MKIKLELSYQPPVTRRTSFVVMTLVMFVVLFSATSAHAQAALSGTLAFEPAESGRTSLDIGGVWNGTTEVTSTTGDSFRYSLENVSMGSEVATDLSISIELPADVNFVPGSATGTYVIGGGTIAGLDATQVGTTLTLSAPSDVDVPNGDTLDIVFGVTVGTSASSGTVLFQGDVAFGTDDGPIVESEGPNQELVVVASGASTVEATPASQNLAPGATASYTITVTNTGLGGLFDVAIDESAIIPTNFASSLVFVQMQQTPLGVPRAIPGGGTLTAASPGTGALVLPYLAPGESFIVTVDALVDGCLDIENQVSTTNRADLTGSSTAAQVVLDLDQPLISFSPGTFAIPYSGTTSVSFDVDSLGMGHAENVVLTADLASAGVNVVVDDPATWTYNAGAGTFTLAANAGSLDSSTSVPLDLTLSASNICTQSPDSSIVWRSSYQNACDDVYSAPTEVGAVSGAGDAPELVVTKSVSEGRLEIGEAGSYTVGISGTNTSSIQDDPVVVTDVLPTDIVVTSVTPTSGTASCPGGTCEAGETVTWSIPLASVAGAPSLGIDFNAPTDTCSGGDLITNTASVAATTTQACSLSESDADSFLVINNADASLTQNYEVAGGFGATFETGVADDGDGVRETVLGEGEFIPIMASYAFSPGYPGTWTGSIFEDDYAGLTGQSLVLPTLIATFTPNGGSTVSAAIPAPSIVASTGQLEISLDFLTSAPFSDDGNIAGDSLVIDYQTTASDADIPVPGFTRSVTQRATLTLAGPPGAGACTTTGNTFVQGDFYDIARARSTPTIAMPSTIDVCIDFPITLTATPEGPGDPSHLALTLDTGSDYEIDTAQSPTAGGFFSTEPTTFDDNSGVDPFFTVDDIFAEQSSVGTYSMTARWRATSGTTPSPLGVRTDYDDNESAADGDVPADRDFSQTAADIPVLIREGDLSIFVSPQTVTVVDDEVRWLVYVTNVGDGVVVDATITDTLPSQTSPDALLLIPNAAETDSANSSGNVSNVSISGGTTGPLVPYQMAWEVGEQIPPITGPRFLNPGTTEVIEIVANVADFASGGATCSIAANANLLTAQWGCGGVDHQLTAQTDPNFIFPAGQLQVLHNSTETNCALCDTGRDEIIVRNVGSTHIFDVEVDEYITFTGGSSGLTPVNGTVEVNIDGGGWQPPTAQLDFTLNAGTALDPWTFTATQVAELADLAPISDTSPGSVSEIRIRFDVAADQFANASAPALVASGSGSIACGAAVNSNADTFSVPVQAPNITVLKTGRNATLNPSGTFVETVYGASGEVVEWEVSVTNGGDFEAREVRLADVFAQSGSSGTITSGPAGFSTPTPIADDTAVSILDIPAGATHVYVIEETLAGSCGDGTNTADVTWDCAPANAAGVRSDLSSPSTNSDSAQLVMIPDFSGGAFRQSFNDLSNGRLEVEIDIRNDGAEAQNLVFTDTLPAGWQIDTSFTPTITSTALTIASVNTADPTVPVITFAGTLRNGETADVRFRILPTSGFDTLSDPLVNPEASPATDPALPGSASNQIRLDWDSSCAVSDSRTRSNNFTPPQPDLDVSVTPDAELVTDLEVVDFAFAIINNGDADSNANEIVFSGTLGLGWSSVTATATPAGGSASACNVVCTTSCVVTCDATVTGDLDQGQTLAVAVQATANDNGSPLSFTASVTGNLHDDAGTDTGNNYSFDEITPRVVGFTFDKSLVPGSSTQTFTADPNLAIGEEATWLVTARWFGGEAISSILIRDSLAAGLGYVSDADTGSTDVTVSGVTAPTPVASGSIEWTISDIGGGVGLFERNVVTRVLNVVPTIDETDLTNNVGLTFSAFGTTYASDDADDGFGGMISDAHAEGQVTIHVPILAFDKQVRNLTTGGGFADSATGDAGDVFEYQITVTNSGNAPAFDLAVGDLLDGKLDVTDITTDLLDNDGDGTPDDGGGEGTLTPGVQDALAWNDANTSIPAGAPEDTFAQLDPGQSITLLYRATTDGTVTPSEQLDNAADLFGSTLPGVTGGQSDPGDTDGERILVGTDVASLTVDPIGFSKDIDTTSVGGDANAGVVIGEQIRFELAIEVPQGQVTAFEVDDVLPEGLRLIATPAVTFGAAIVETGQPSITPSSLPATGASVPINWDFGTRNVGAGSAADRTITIQYVTQVENLPSLDAGETLVNDASYTFNGSPVNMADVTLTVLEPSIAVSKSLLSGAGPYAPGSLLTYQVDIVNSGTSAAYDLRIVDTLPTGLSYEAGSTTLVVPTGSLGEPDVAGQIATWGRTQSAPQDIDLTSPGTYRFTYQARVNEDAQPGQTIANDVDVDWTSLDGSPGPNLGVPVGTSGGLNGERDGTTTGAVDYSGSSSIGTTVESTYAIAKSVRNDELDAFTGGFRIGDIVTFEIVIDVSEGTTPDSHIRDTLPPGLTFVSFDPISPSSGANGFTFTAPTSGGGTAPAPGATGSLDWDLGSILNSVDGNAANDQLTLVYRARVTDNATAFPPATTTFAEDDDATFVHDDAVGAPQTVGPDGAPYNIVQPALSLAKSLRAGQPTTVTSSDTVAFRLEIDNTGDAPAYNIALRDVLPDGMRDATPTTIAGSIDGTPVTLATPSYSSVSGILVWTLDDTQTLLPGDRLVVDYNATIDADVGGNRTLDNAARVEEFFSRRAADPTERRSYGAQPIENASVSTPSPSDLTKVVDVSEAGIGETIVHTLTVPGTAVDVALFDVNVTDALPATVRFDGSTDNSAALSATLTDSSSGNAFDISVDVIPAGQQLVLQLSSTVLNLPSTNDGTSIDNQAGYTWASTPAGPASAPILSGTAQTIVREPSIDVDKVIVSPMPATDVEGGDTITFRIDLFNSGDAPAYDVVVTDVADELFINPAIGAGGPSGITQGPTSGGTTTWTLDPIAGPIAPMSTTSFTVAFDISNAVSPFENLTNRAGATWTSTPGANGDERDGTGTPSQNDYQDDSPIVNVTVGPAGLTKSALSPLDGTIAIGEEVTYALTLDAPVGSIDRLRLVDALPTGLVFVSASLTSVSDLQRQGGGAVTVLTEPSPGATGSLTFDLGDLESTGTDPGLTLELITRVADIPANAAGAPALSNLANALFDDPANPGSDVTVGSGSVDLTIVEPTLDVALDGPAIIEQGLTTSLTLRAVNSGNSPAYQPGFEIELPVGLRSVDPTTLTLALDIDGSSLNPSDYTLSWNSATGILELNLTTAAGVIPPGGLLTFAFEAEPVDVTDGAMLSLLATATDVYSQDIASGVGTDVRNTQTVLGTGTTGTPDAGVPDDSTDDYVGSVTSPALLVTKSVTDDGDPAPGEVLSYSVTIANSGSADAVDATFADDLDQAFAAGTLTAVVVTPPTAIEAPGALTVDSNGGANGTGRIDVTGLRIVAGASVTVSFDASLANSLPNGTLVRNQASLAVPGLSQTLVSDSTNASDDDGAEGGNAPGDPNDDDPTRTLIGSAPILEVTKSVTDDNGTPLVVGDTLTYTIVVDNSGDETAVNSVIQDTIPAGTTYVAGTTTLNGGSVADVSGVSALAAGTEVSSPSRAAGELYVGEPATLTFQVQVNSDVDPGASISNQALVSVEGEGSGPLPPEVGNEPSDDPSTSTEDDPTVLVVGDVPRPELDKTVVDENGGALVVGDFLTWQLTARNIGGGSLTNIVVRDAMPADVAFVPGSMTFDPDGSGPLAASPLTDAVDGDEADFDISTSNSITLGVADLLGGEEAVLTFRTEVAPGTAAGTVIANQAVLESTGQSPEPSDDNANDDDGDQPTEIVVGSVPVLRLSKQVFDLDGGMVQPGDVLEYWLTLENIGSASATNVRVSESAATFPPASTSYESNSTTLDGGLRPDQPGPASELNAAGGVFLGTVAAGESRLIRTRVRINAGTPVGTVIDNQANYVGDAGLSGVSDSDLDDGSEGGNDPGDPDDDDPTRISVGGTASLSSVEGFVWQDTDHDRMFDAGESGQSGWTVEILRGGIVVDTTTTDLSGRYSFSGLPSGSGYEIRFRHPTSGVVWGQPVSGGGAADTSGGTLAALTLPPGVTILDQSLPLDPSGVVYDSLLRTPVPGVIANIAGPPGFDPAIHLLPGQQGQVTGPDGFYRFDLVPGAPTGTYTLQFTEPPGYLPPASVLIPPQTTLDLAPGTPDPFEVLPFPNPPTTADPTTYHLSFVIEAGDPNIVNNHVPIDPVLEGAISLVKTSQRITVSRAEIVPYSIQATNAIGVTLPNIAIQDRLPPGFVYVEGSARVDGVAVEPTRVGDQLTWGGLTIGANSTVEVTLLLIVGAAANEGEYTNRAWAINELVNERASNEGQATVRIVPDPTFDCTDILGRVFDDRNGNGYHDEGETGLPGIRMMTVRGLRVESDARGRFHITCAMIPREDRGSNFILKLDDRTLPTGYRLTTENPRVIRVTRGKFAEIMFGAALPREIRIELDSSAFNRGSVEWTRETEETLTRAAELVREGPATVVLAYTAGSETRDLGDRRIDAIENELRDRVDTFWHRHPFEIERERATSFEVPEKGGVR